MASCSFSRTQTIIEIRADGRVMSDADEIHVEVRDAANQVVFTRDMNPMGASFVGFPLEIPVTARNGDDSRNFELRASAIANRRQADGSILVTTLAQNRVRTSFRRGEVLRFTLWLLSGCRCNVETERCEPDSDGDLVPECVSQTIDVNPTDAGIVDSSIDATTDTRVDDRNNPPPVSMCTTAQRLCGAQCVSRNSPVACGESCSRCDALPGGDAVCENDACGVNCAASTPDRCPSACVNLENDRSHCGTCGNACANGRLCVNRNCTTPPQCTMAQDPACTGMSYCNLTTRMCAAGCDGRSGQCPPGLMCNTQDHNCVCVSGTQMCGSVCATCPSGANITSVGCDGNACIVIGCNAGFARNSANTQCLDVNECDSNNGGCATGVLCTNTPGGRTCGACPTGYAGNGETCTDINECDSNNGGCGLATCSNMPGSFSCSCSMPNRTCNNVCVACPSDVNATTFGCSGAACVVGGCGPGFTPNTMGSACVADTPSPWSPLMPSGGPVTASSDHAMVYDSQQNRVVLFGFHGLNETWVLRNDSWSRLTNSPRPAPRRGHAMAYDSHFNRILLFGGDGGSDGSFHQDTWQFMGNSWSQVSSVTNPPAARLNHTMVYDSQRDRIVLFGGINTNGMALNDTWVYDGGWSRLNTSGAPPGNTSQSAMVYDSQRNRIVLFGTQAGADVWVLNGSTWSPLVTSGAPPPDRGGHAMVYDSQQDRFVIFGGYDGSNWLDDTWILSGNTWSPVLATTRPSGRSRPVMVYDSQRSRVVLFGGYNGSDFNDTWVFH